MTRVPDDEARPLIIAHRGDSAHAPENTLAAFQRAVDAGADGIEFDVRLTKDGDVAVFHDSSLNRIAGRPGKVLQLTSEELRAVDAGSWFNRRHPDRADPIFAMQRIPTLREVLHHLQHFNGLLYIELKFREEDVERLAHAVGEVIRDSPLLPRMIVKSFKLKAIPRVREMCPEVRTAALFAPKVRSLLNKEKNILRLAEDVRADEVSVHYTLATRKLCSEAARRGFDVVVWTADHPRWVKRGSELGLKAVITNDPAKLLAKREELGRSPGSAG